MNTIRSVCVYCGSSPGRDGIYLEAGRQLGHSLARSGLRLVYGGGTKGIMGAVAEGTMRAGGKVMGIIPRFLMNREATESALDRLHELVVTDNMHQRKHRMFEESDAFVALPGGIGTVEEIVEIMTWAQLGHHRKPIVFANIKITPWIEFVQNFLFVDPSGMLVTMGQGVLRWEDIGSGTEGDKENDWQGGGWYE